MDAPRPSGTRRALLIGLPLAALAAAAFLFMDRDEPRSPKAGAIEERTRFEEATPPSGRRVMVLRG